MELTPREKDKLLIFAATLLAENPNRTRRYTPWSREGTFPTRGIETFGAYIPQANAKESAWS